MSTASIDEINKIYDLLNLIVGGGFVKEAYRWVVEGMTREAESSFDRAGVATHERKGEDVQAELERAKKLLGLLAQIDMEAL